MINIESMIRIENYLFLTIFYWGLGIGHRALGIEERG
jgi:hypothetical protein